jgi:hypothetical protein
MKRRGRQDGIRHGKAEIIDKVWEIEDSLSHSLPQNYAPCRRGRRAQLSHHARHCRAKSVSDRTEASLRKRQRGLITQQQQPGVLAGEGEDSIIGGGGEDGRRYTHW